MHKAKVPDRVALLVNELESHASSLVDKFLAPFFPLNPAHRPRDYEHEVKAACVLTHAAYEEFVETISLHVMVSCTNAWLNQRQASDPLLALCLCYEVKINVEEDETKTQPQCFDQLRQAFDEAKKKHSHTIRENHGFSLKYLRAALTPVFINPPDEVRLTESLRTLAAARGSFAHSAAKDAMFEARGKGAKARTSLSPEDARNAILDCLQLCRDIARSCSKLLSPLDYRYTHVPFRRKLENQSRRIR